MKKEKKKNSALGKRASFLVKEKKKREPWGFGRKSGERVKFPYKNPPYIWGRGETYANKKGKKKGGVVSYPGKGEK